MGQKKYGLLESAGACRNGGGGCLAPWIPPQTQSRLWKDPTNSSTLCATRREKQFQGHKFWQEEVDRVGESSGEKQEGIQCGSGADVPVLRVSQEGQRSVCTYWPPGRVSPSKEIATVTAFCSPCRKTGRRKDQHRAPFH